jgi:curved DNA-binding protein
MEFKDYYATLGVARTATGDEIKRAYRKLARKYHPDVSKEPDAEARFKEVSEAYEALSDAEKRAAYDDIGQRHSSGQPFNPPPGWDSGFEFSGRDFGDGADLDHSDFFEALFGRQAAGMRGARASRHHDSRDHHAKVLIDLQDAYRGATRSISLRLPQIDSQGRVAMIERQLDLQIPKGIRAGQHLRLAGQGGPGQRGEPPGDLYLEVDFAAHPQFRVDGRDVFVDLSVAPWEAALGASVPLPTPAGQVEITIPPGSSSGRKLRLKGQGLPSAPPGDLYAVLSIVQPPADTAAAQAAYQALAESFKAFDPRRAAKG